jgi:hypothetical protein
MQIRFSLHISSELHWNVRIGGVMIEADILNALPRTLSSAASLVEVINTLESCHFCVGNDDEKYHPIQAARKGVFMNATGEVTVKTVPLKV